MYRTTLQRLYTDKRAAPAGKRPVKDELLIVLFEAYGRGEGLPNWLVARGGRTDGACISGKRRIQELAIELPALCGWEIRTQRIGKSSTFVHFLVSPEDTKAAFDVWVDNVHGVDVYRFAAKTGNLF